MPAGVTTAPLVADVKDKPETVPCKGIADTVHEIVCEASASSTRSRLFNDCGPAPEQIFIVAGALLTNTGAVFAALTTNSTRELLLVAFRSVPVLPDASA